MRIIKQAMTKIPVNAIGVTLGRDLRASDTIVDFTRLGRAVRRHGIRVPKYGARKAIGIARGQ